MRKVQPLKHSIAYFFTLKKSDGLGEGCPSERPWNNFVETVHNTHRSREPKTFWRLLNSARNVKGTLRTASDQILRAGQGVTLELTL